jgi:Helix-hairpin-helix domain
VASPLVVQSEEKLEKAESAGIPGWGLVFAGWLWASALFAAPMNSSRADHATESGAIDSRGGAASSAPRSRFGPFAGASADVELDAGGASFETRRGAVEIWCSAIGKRRGASDFVHMSPRELRHVPGIGQARALAIARTRWQESASRDLGFLERVPGIGPDTAKRIKAWLERTH